VPGRVVGHLGVDVRGDEAEVGVRELPVEGVAARVAQRRQLLEVCELADVDLLGEMAADRLLERLAPLEVAARKRPGSEERLTRALPEQRLEPPVADLEDDRQRDLSRVRGGRLLARFSTHRQKLANGGPECAP